MTGAECPRSVTRGERRRDTAATCSSSPSSPSPSSTPQRQTWPALEPQTRAARGSDVTQMQVTSWRGGAGQAAVTAVAPNAGQAAVGSRLKDGRADSAPCDQLVCYTRCDFCSSTVADCARGRPRHLKSSVTLTNPSRSDFHPRFLNASYYYRALRVVVDKNRDFKTR